MAEVWEAFKNENFAAFQALTDAEVEDIEGEIMRLKRKDRKKKLLRMTTTGICE